jgi:hypothetical protein
MSGYQHTYLKFIPFAVSMIAGTLIFFKMIKKDHQVNTSYSSEEIVAFKEHCMQDFSPNDHYPLVVRKYCNCYVEAVTQKYNKSHLQSLSHISKQERELLLDSIINNCAAYSGLDTTNRTSEN